MDILYSIVDRKSLALRGLVAVIFGVIALVATGFVLDFLVYVFGFFAIISGILTAGIGLSSEKTELPRWLLVTTGVLGILVGIFALVTPLVVAVAITIFIAAWFLITGITDIGLAVTHKKAHHRILLALSGIAGVVVAIILVFAPVFGAYTLVIVLGIYAVAAGFISIFLGLSLGKEKAVIETQTSL
jgi:uncharacterized membrane protein HdeD (DUF308 family)